MLVEKTLSTSESANKNRAPRDADLTIVLFNLGLT